MREGQDRSKTYYQNLQIPTLLSVFGSKEENYLSRYEELETLMPNTELFVISGADHAQTFRRPEFLPKVREFPAEHQSADRPLNKMTSEEISIGGERTRDQSRT